MAPKYRLTYFSVQAVGEPMRWLLSYGNNDFEDVRLNKADWPNFKPKTPFGQLPLLEVDGETLWQNTAICRWLAKDLNLLGKTNKDALHADIIVDTITDFRQQCGSYYYDQNPETKAPKRAPLHNETVPYFTSRLENIVKENNGYFVNGQLTWADIYFSAMTEYISLMADIDILEGRPNLTALNKKVRSIPQIQKWIQKRPPNAS